MMQIPYGSLPGASPLFVDYTANESRIRAFYPNGFDFDSILNFARKRRDAGLPHREALCRILGEQERARGGNTDSVDRLARGAVAVVTGQQPGLFSGPLYTILKAVTIVKLARQLSDAGIDAVPVFWAAAEDHDYEEIQWACVLDRDTTPRRFQVDLANDEALPSGWMRFKNDVQTVVADCLSSLPPSEFQPELRDLLESTYRSGRSPVDSFAAMMARLFASSGVILVDPLDLRMKDIAAPVLSRVAEKSESIRRAVSERSRAILAAGYHEQVKVDQNFTGLFAFRGKSRQNVKPDQLAAIDGMLSPNVLVRPAVQDTIFPTAVFVAGPSEIAYLAQAAVVYQNLGKELPPVFPRISATLLETRIAKWLNKYNLQFSDVFHGKEFIKRRAVENAQSTEVFGQAKQELGQLLESLRPALNAVDPTLIGALDNAKQKMIYQVEGLETKFINAEARRNDLLEKHLDAISNSLFPEKKLQERQLNIVSFLARYGTTLLRRLEDNLPLDPTQHQLFEI